MQTSRVQELDFGTRCLRTKCQPSTHHSDQTKVAWDSELETRGNTTAQAKVCCIGSQNLQRRNTQPQRVRSSCNNEGPLHVVAWVRVWTICFLICRSQRNKIDLISLCMKLLWFPTCKRDSLRHRCFDRCSYSWPCKDRRMLLTMRDISFSIVRSLLLMVSIEVGWVWVLSILLWVHKVRFRYQASLRAYFRSSEESECKKRWKVPPWFSIRLLV